MLDLEEGIRGLFEEAQGIVPTRYPLSKEGYSYFRRSGNPRSPHFDGGKLHLAWTRKGGLAAVASHFKIGNSARRSFARKQEAAANKRRSAIVREMKNKSRRALLELRLQKCNPE